MKAGLPLAAALAVLLVLAVPVLFAGLDRTDLVGDEAIYAGLVDRMLAGGSWLTPEGHDGPFLEKPPLKIWLVALARRAGALPAGEGGYRGLDPFFGLAALVYVVLIGRRLAGLPCGLAAAVLLLASHPFIFEQGLRAHAMESLLVLAHCAGVYHFLAWAAPGGRAAHAYAFAAWCAVGFLVKYVGIAFLPAAALLALLLTPAWRARARAERATWARAALLFLGLAAPWFLAETVVHGLRFWEHMSLHVFVRMGGHVDPRHVHPWWFYAGALEREWRGAGPWILAGLLLLAVRAVRGRDGAAVLVLGWAVVPMLVLSASESKIRHYLHPYLPAYALCGGYALQVLVKLAAWLGAGVERAWSPAAHRRAVPFLLVVAGAALVLAVVVLVMGPVE
ncbi:MAG TPA: glycosyltransferase family 39 protein, partial [Vicinamibacteria bacterium]|nr:glycosyltransferase family 39 protein [Vicinamibacteria bacterium]